MYLPRLSKLDTSQVHYCISSIARASEYGQVDILFLIHAVNDMQIGQSVLFLCPFHFGAEILLPTMCTTLHLLIKSSHKKSKTTSTIIKKKYDKKKN